MDHVHPDHSAGSAARTLAEVEPPPPHPFWLTLLATLGGLIIPAIAAIAAAILLGPPRVPHASKTAALAAATLTIAEAIFAGLGAAALIEAGWRRVGLPGSGPANFLPLRWIRHRIAHRNVNAIIASLRQAPPQASRESLRALLELSRELARRDIYTRAHSGRVSRLSVEVGQKIGLSPEEREVARLAGLLHDIGKLEIPASILNKPGPLDPDEAELVRNHPLIGAALVSPYIGTDVVNAVRHHHERLDGAGYPDGVDADAMPIIARLVPVVDTYDALISDRAYRPGRSREEAFIELRAVAGSQLDPELVEALIEVEAAKVPLGGALLGLAPVSALLRRAEHLLHGSAAPAAAAVTAIAVAGAGWLGVMGSGGTRVQASKDSRGAIVSTSPSIAPTEAGGAPETPEPVATDQTPSGSPLPTPSSAGTGKATAPLYFPSSLGKKSGSTGSSGVLVTPKTTTNPANGQPVSTNPQVIAVGPAPSTNPTSNSPAPPPPPPAPSISGISPTTGPAATVVTINGANFSGATGVKFGATPASAFTINSSGQISATAPGGAGAVPVSVSGPGGTATGPSFTYVGPSVTTISPFFGPASGGTPVTITGNNLNGAFKVWFGPSATTGTPAQSFTVNSNTQITAVSPRYAGVQEIDVYVTTPAGTSATPAGDQQFDYGPDLHSISPTQAGIGGSIRIAGTNFNGATTVRFGGTSATSFTVNSDTLITAVVPPAGGTVDVVVSNPTGDSDTVGGDRFRFLPPSISGINPTSGNGGTSVTINGSHFTGVSGPNGVRFGSTPASYTFNNDGSITAVAPPGLFNGQAVQVTTPAGTSNSVNFQYPAPPPPTPVITTLSPNPGPSAGGTITISGTNLANASAVHFGAATITPTSSTATSVSFTAPPGTMGTTVAVNVTTPGGTSNSLTFTYGP